jgi:dynein heavy chain
LQGGEAEDVRLYKDIGGFEETKKIFSGVLELYNQENKAMTLVLFEMAIDHLCRIHRIIRNPRGYVLV